MANPNLSFHWTHSRARKTWHRAFGCGNAQVSVLISGVSLRPDGRTLMLGQRVIEDGDSACPNCDCDDADVARMLRMVHLPIAATVQTRDDNGDPAAPVEAEARITLPDRQVLVIHPGYATYSEVSVLRGEFYSPHVLRGAMAKEFAQDAGAAPAFIESLGEASIIVVLAVRRFYFECQPRNPNGYESAVAASPHPNIVAPPSPGQGRVCLGQASPRVSAIATDVTQSTLMGQSLSSGCNWESPLHNVTTAVQKLPADRYVWSEYSQTARPATDWDCIESKAIANAADWATYFSCQQTTYRGRLNPANGTHWSGGRCSREVVDNHATPQSIAESYGCGHCEMKCPMKTAGVGLPSRGAVNGRVGGQIISHSPACNLHTGTMRAWEQVGVVFDEGHKLRYTIAGAAYGHDVYDAPRVGGIPAAGADWVLHGARDNGPPTRAFPSSSTFQRDERGNLAISGNLAGKLSEILGISTGEARDLILREIEFITTEPSQEGRHGTETETERVWIQLGNPEPTEERAQRWQSTQRDTFGIHGTRIRQLAPNRWVVEAPQT